MLLSPRLRDYECQPEEDLQGLAHAYGESHSMPRKGSYDQVEVIKDIFAGIILESVHTASWSITQTISKNNTLTSPMEQSQRRRANALHTGRQKRPHQQRIQVESLTLSSSRFLMVRFMIASSFQKNKLVWRGKCYYIHLSRHPYPTEGNKV